MNTRLLALACSCLLMPAFAVEPITPKGHLFILSGQSNMTGNLEQGFRQKVEAKYGAEKVTIVRSMKSGRGIRFWVSDYGLPEGTAPTPKDGKPNSNGEEYPKLLAVAKAAGDAAAFKSVTFVWMQGESDAMSGRADLYAPSFLRLRQRLMNDLGIKTMHVVIGRISDFGLKGERAEGWRAMREVQERLAKDLDHAAWFNTDDLNDVEGKPEGDLHYPKEGSIVLGQRLAEKAIEMISDYTQLYEESEEHSMRESVLLHEIELLMKNKDYAKAAELAQIYLDRKNGFTKYAGEVRMLLAESFDKQDMRDDAIVMYVKIWAIHMGQIRVSSPAIARWMELMWDRNRPAKDNDLSDRQAAYESGARYIQLTTRIKDKFTEEELKQWERVKKLVESYQASPEIKEPQRERNE